VEKAVKGPTLGLIKRLLVKLNTAVPTRRSSRPGWKGEIQFYAFRCPVHGVVGNYPAGYSQVLACPECSHESAK